MIAQVGVAHDCTEVCVPCMVHDCTGRWPMVNRCCIVTAWAYSSLDI